MTNFLLTIIGILGVTCAAIVIAAYSPNFKSTVERLWLLAFGGIALMLVIGSVI